MKAPDFLRGMGDSGFREYHNPDSEAAFSNRFAYLRHVNIHRDPHLLSLEHPLVRNEKFKDTVNEDVILASGSSGRVFAFSTTSGKYWLFNGNTVTHLGKNPNAPKGHKGAYVHHGFVFSVSKTNQIASFLERDHKTVKYSVGTLSGRYATPIVGLYRTVYFGSGSDIQFFDLSNADYVTGTLPSLNTTSVSQAFFNSTIDTARLPVEWQVTDMIAYGNELLIGVAAKNSGATLRWSPYTSRNFYSVDYLEGVVNFFFRSYTDDNVFAVVHHEPEIFSYTNSKLNHQQSIKDVKAIPNTYANATIDGIAFFAMENRIYSYYQKKNGYNFALVHSFTCTGGRSAIITSMAAVDYKTSGDQLYVSWYNPETGEAGVDNIDYSSYVDDGLIVTAIKKWTQESSHDALNSKQQEEPKYGYQVMYHYDPAHEAEEDTVKIEVAVNNNVEIRNPEDFGTEHDPQRMLYGQEQHMTYGTGECEEYVRLSQAFINVKPYNGRTPILNGIELM